MSYSTTLLTGWIVILVEFNDSFLVESEKIS